MKQQLLLLGVVLVIASCTTSRPTLGLDEIFDKRFEHKMISSGQNFPDFYVENDSLDLFLVALHERIPPNEFRKKAGWTKKLLKTYTDLLISKNWLVSNNRLLPTIFIATDTQGKGLFAYSTPIALEIARSIETQLVTVKKAYRKMDISKTHEFDALSFFLLSNVLLDNWQINNVERDFLKAEERPGRHGMHYYYAIMENTNYPKEDFGIYGNSYSSINDSIAIGVYGNNRNIVSDALARKDRLEKIIQSAPRITKSDNAILKEIATAYKSELIRILDKNIPYIQNVYEKSEYAEEISFEEFFIWWYHFIYTQATNMLADSGLLQLPDSGNFIYVVEQ